MDDGGRRKEHEMLERIAAGILAAVDEALDAYRIYWRIADVVRNEVMRFIDAAESHALDLGSLYKFLVEHEDSNIADIETEVRERLQWPSGDVMEFLNDRVPEVVGTLVTETLEEIHDGVVEAYDAAVRRIGEYVEEARQ
jgi:hypothetical protein